MDHPASSQPPHLPRKKSAPGHFRFGRVLSRWWWLAAIVIVGMIATAYKLPDWFKMRGPLYESTALIEVVPHVDISASPTSSGTGLSPHGSRFMNTQKEIVTATGTLERAMKEAGLIDRLGGNQTAVLDRMRRSTYAIERRGTDLLEIVYRDEDPQLAFDAVTAIKKSYTDRRKELAIQLQKDEAVAIEIELKTKKKIAAEKRADLVHIAKKLGIIWHESEAGAEFNQAAQLASRSQIEKQLYEANREKEKLSFEISKLLKLDDNEAMLLLYYEESANAEGKKRYEKYLAAYTDLQNLINSGLGDGHPELLLKEKEVAGLKEGMGKRAITKRDTLKIKLKLIEQRTDQLRKKLNEHTDLGTTGSKSFQEFNMALKEYKSARKSVEEIVNKNTRLGPDPTLQIVHQEPTLATNPITKGRDFFTILFTAIAIPCALITAFILIYLAEAIFPRQLQRSKTASA